MGNSQQLQLLIARSPIIGTRPATKDPYAALGTLDAGGLPCVSEASLQQDGAVTDCSVIPSTLTLRMLLL